ncbi:cell division protein FtsL [Trichlorobacter lovleyi]|uniref:cell division protein FtsL n=1 Tax=Trichlorobacter lovleyi TaxID=313985 RepID=UPI00223FD509|nr:cell division protein FtsL [Trichlorobacter lovleyi]QOX77901.1 cell division protein FtsL [Trichlorobacter lovleyi]
MGMVKTDSTKLTFPSHLGTDLAPRRMDIVKFLMVCMLLLTVVSIFHVWSRFRLIELNLQIGEASRQLKDLEQEQKQLKLEAESLKTPARIEVIAKRDLGMTVPQDQQVILVK